MPRLKESPWDAKGGPGHVNVNTGGHDVKVNLTRQIEVPRTRISLKKV
jgi:hypothetical protein